MSLEGKVAIVTGGGRELGRAAAIGLAKAGARVVIAEIEDFGAETAQEISSMGPGCLFVKTDVSKKAEVDRMVERAVSEYSRIDILVNNAAIYPFRAWDAISEEEWDRVFAVNVKGQFLCSRAVVKHMRKAGKGKIINLASVTFFIGFPNFLHYSSSKGAVVGLTRTLARELGPDNISVNAVSPGAFPTRAEMVTFSGPGEQEAYSKSVLEKQCIKRRGRPDDIGSLVVFLAGDESDFITGQTVEIDGGWVMH